MYQCISVSEYYSSNEWTPNRPNIIDSSKHQGPKRQSFVGRFPSIQIGRLNPSFSTHLTDYATSTHAVHVLLQDNLLLSVVQFVAANHPYTFFCEEGYCCHIGYLRLCGIQLTFNILTTLTITTVLRKRFIQQTTHNSIANQVIKQTLINFVHIFNDERDSTMERVGLSSLQYPLLIYQSTSHSHSHCPLFESYANMLLCTCEWSLPTTSYQGWHQLQR